MSTRFVRTSIAGRLRRVKPAEVELCWHWWTDRLPENERRPAWRHSAAHAIHTRPVYPVEEIALNKNDAVSILDGTNHPRRASDSVPDHADAERFERQNRPAA